MQPLIQHGFSPYTDNGGTTVAVAGDDFCIVAGDTRQSEGYSINSRYAPKVFGLSNNAVLATSGFHADGVTLTKKLEQRLETYQFQHAKHMSVQSLAQMLSTILYGKRFFPYYVFSILGGLDEQGKGAVYSYDPVGSFERERYRTGGSASHLIQPFLDNQLGLKHQKGAKPSSFTIQQTIRIIRDAFTSATERDIYTGDYLEVFIITKDQVTVEKYDLKKD